jgi:short-subunit dehydrogenase
VLWLDPDDVVNTALADLRDGRGVSIPGWTYRAVSLAMRLTPRTIYMPLSKGLLGRFM